MSKKIFGFCAVLAALVALAIPASASAATTLAEACGGSYCPLSPGAKVTATQAEHAVFEFGSVQVTCDHNWMTGEVHTNDHTNGITVTITAAKFQGALTGTSCNGGVWGATKMIFVGLTNEGGTGHWCMKNIPGTNKFELPGRGCTESGSGTLTFILEGSITCTYTRSEAISGEYTTTKEDPTAATLKVTNEPSLSKEAPSSFLCPANGKIKTMAFYLYTHNSEEAPVYITD